MRLWRSRQGWGLIVCCMALTACTLKAPEGMVLIPKGDFVMGTDDVALEEKSRAYGIVKPWVLDASPSHKVSLDAFFMDTYEVTNGDYLRFVESAGFSPLPHWPGGRPTPQQERLPVVYVNWEEARAYCQWTGGHLPTEQEWEKAARGTDGRLYPWGNEFDPQRANFGGSFSGVTLVGSLPSGNSPYGAADMVGNVWEWTDSLYRPYENSSYRTEDYGKSYRVVRGSSWSGLGHFPPGALKEVMSAQARLTYRLFLRPKIALEDVGFRCARSKD